MSYQPEDQSIFSVAAGIPEGQQLWECLAVLIGIDVWSAHWKQDRIVLKVRVDNVGALTLLLKVRPSIPSLAIVARELALRLVELSFIPDAVHTPGVVHVIADRLSCIFAPGGSGMASFSLHPSLKDAVLTPVPVRDRCWHRDTGIWGVWELGALVAVGATLWYGAAVANFLCTCLPCNFRCGFLAALYTYV